MNQRKKRKQGLSITEKRMIVGCILLALSAALTVITGQYPKTAEWYSENIYPVIVSTMGRFSGLFPFSLSELCLYVLIILLLGSLIHAGARSFQGEQGGAVMLQWASGLFLAAAMLAFLYVANCGVNYKRISFSEKAEIQTEEYSVGDLALVCEWLTKEVNTRASQVSRNSSGVMELEAPQETAAVDAMKQLSTIYPELAGYYPKPKKILVSGILSWQALTGVYSPFTVEANFNKDMSPYNIPFTACHELSHLRGFMQEEEANFIAFLACKDARRMDFQYSGYLMGWIYSMNALQSVDYDAWQEVRQGLDSQVVADLEHNSRFWAKHDGAVAEVSNKVNDTYLKVNGQSDGVHSYDRMVDLIVGYHLKNQTN